MGRKTERNLCEYRTFMLLVTTTHKYTKRTTRGASSSLPSFLLVFLSFFSSFFFLSLLFHTFPSTTRCGLHRVTACINSATLSEPSLFVSYLEGREEEEKRRKIHVHPLISTSQYVSRTTVHQYTETMETMNTLHHLHCKLRAHA